jgi:hypothetical protein
MDEFGRYAATIEAAGEIKLERRIGRARGWRSIQKIRRDVARSRRLLRRAWDVAETGDMARAVEMAETAADMTR